MCKHKIKKSVCGRCGRLRLSKATTDLGGKDVSDIEYCENATKRAQAGKANASGELSTYACEFNEENSIYVEANDTCEKCQEMKRREEERGTKDPPGKGISSYSYQVDKERHPGRRE